MDKHHRVRRVLRARYLLVGLLILAAGLWVAHPRALHRPKFHTPSPDEITTSPAAQRLRAGAAGANLIIILLDAARADHFTSFGHKLNTTPNIAKLFDRSILFTEAYSAAPNTKASVASLFTSQFPDTHGALSLPWPFIAQGATLPECMRAAGYTTAAFLGNPTISESFGFRRGFDSFTELFRHPSRSPLGPGVVDGARVLRASVDWFRAHNDERFFAYVHFLEPHAPYYAPADFRRRFLGGADPGSSQPDQSLRYDASLAYVDSLVGKLLQELEALDVLDKSVVVVLADHGEAFGEHGVYGHTTTVYREMVYVPVGIHLPARCSASPRRQADVFCLTDLMPTLLDLLQIPPPDTMQGRTRLGLLAGEEEKTPAFAVSRSRGNDASGGEKKPSEVSYALRVPRYTLLLADHGQRVELYDHETSLGEQANIAGERRDMVKQLNRQFRSWAATQRARPVVLWGGKVLVTHSEEAKLSDETRQQLKSLGYLK